VVTEQKRPGADGSEASACEDYLTSVNWQTFV
jgi:hypothetical protein